MRKCHLYLNGGRNTQLIYQDALRALADWGFEPACVTLCELRRDEPVRLDTAPHDAPVYRMWADRAEVRPPDFDATPPSAVVEDRLPPVERVFIVLNGGTTLQQWAVGSLYWWEKLESVEADVTRVPSRHTPCTVLDVQRDSVTILAELG